MATRILIADPSQDNRVLLARACSLLGCESECVETPVDAKTALDVGPHALFVCSLDWPKAPEGGIELLCHASQVESGVTTILLAAANAYVIPTQLPFSDLHACLPKPLPPPEIVAIALISAIRSQTRALGTLRNLSMSLRETEDPRQIIEATALALLSSLNIDAVALRRVQPTEQARELPPVTRTSGPLSAAENQDLSSLLETAALPGAASGSVSAQELSWKHAAWTAVATAEGERLAGVIVSKTTPLSSPSYRRLLETCLSFSSAVLSLAAKLEQAHDLASRDNLTGLYSHGHFLGLVRSEIERARVDQSPLAVIMLDVDSRHGLKEINDQYGHQAGDRLVVYLAEILSSHVRPNDRVARYGGDEFLILAPNTDAQQAQALAQTLVDTVQASELAVSESVHVQMTLSAGVAILEPAQEGNADDLLARMDRALYAAKEKGASRIHVDRGDSG